MLDFNVCMLSELFYAKASDIETGVLELSYIEGAIAICTTYSPAYLLLLLFRLYSLIITIC